jgi:hypothetical protein
MRRATPNRFRPTLDALEDRLVLSSAAHHVHVARPHHPAYGHHGHAGEAEVNHVGGHP